MAHLELALTASFYQILFLLILQAAFALLATFGTELNAYVIPQGDHTYQAQHVSTATQCQEQLMPWEVTVVVV